MSEWRRVAKKKAFSHPGLLISCKGSFVVSLSPHLLSCTFIDFYSWKKRHDQRNEVKFTSRKRLYSGNSVFKCGILQGKRAACSSRCLSTEGSVGTWQEMFWAIIVKCLLFLPPRVFIWTPRRDKLLVFILRHGVAPVNTIICPREALSSGSVHISTLT